ncbi:hypothetical protein [Brevibacillus borstelensis]|uniref:hypothetical protein n=1 Tax=Brevibacillus borstelensis TaxID=45462 RepID=UPI00287F9525|nr:hypothetical protein [Brevibacillus borstelensis]WNF07456.1 hypothetical protein RFB14_08645 [Brevibacillus borstelensis]
MTKQANVTVLTDENGMQREYVEVKRKARVGERILIIDAKPNDSYHGYKNGDVFVTTTDSYAGGVDSGDLRFWHSEYTVLTPIDAPTASAQQTVINVNLTVTVQPGTDVAQAVADAVKAEISKLAVAHPKSKSAQELRDEIVERAKADVAELTAIGTDEDVLLEGSANVRGDFYRVDFVVNRDKRTVVALVRPTNGYRTFTKGGVTLFKGIAKCSPDDVFNAHIGRAIALRRALGLEVPTEYTNAPKPTEVREGDVVKYDGRTRTVVRGDVTPGKTCEIGSVTATYGKVIDDSREEVSA